MLFMIHVIHYHVVQMRFVKMVSARVKLSSLVILISAVDQNVQLIQSVWAHYHVLQINA